MMGIRGRLHQRLNHWLEPLNVRIETRTAERAEIARLRALDEAGNFSRAIFPVLKQYNACNPELIVDVVKHYSEKTRRFLRDADTAHYSFHNDYFRSPDAEVAYAHVQQLRPKTIIEVGSGNSTLLFREAIYDGKLNTRLIAIDPNPRVSVANIVDEMLYMCLENTCHSSISDALGSGDFLFIDSSHQVKTGNDVVHLMLNVLPKLKPGVIVHFHDIFLPFDYPRSWVVENKWVIQEQYLLQAMLQESENYVVVWAGYFFQRTLPKFAEYFHLADAGDATSLWLRKIK
jgi:hypothetical protein